METKVAEVGRHSYLRTLKTERNKQIIELEYGLGRLLSRGIGNLEGSEEEVEKSIRQTQKTIEIIDSEIERVNQRSDFELLEDIKGVFPTLNYEKLNEILSRQ